MFKTRYVADIAVLEEKLNTFIQNCTIVPILDTEELPLIGITVPMEKIEIVNGDKSIVNMLEIDLELLLQIIREAIKQKVPLQITEGGIRLIYPN